MKFHLKRNLFSYTLVEVMIVTAVTSMIVGGVMTEYVSMLKGYETVNTYRDLHADARYGIDLFTKDMRGADAITSGTTNSINFTVPLAAGTQTISYQLTSNQLIRTASLGTNTETRVVANNVESVEFDYYLRDNTAAADATMAFNVHARVTCSKGIAGVQKVDFIHTRTLLRNKQS
jgi:Tfp pilus assembly protein PilW